MYFVGQKDGWKGARIAWKIKDIIIARTGFFGIEGLSERTISFHNFPRCG